MCVVCCVLKVDPKVLRNTKFARRKNRYGLKKLRIQKWKEALAAGAHATPATPVAAH